MTLHARIARPTLLLLLLTCVPACERRTVPAGSAPATSAEANQASPVVAATAPAASGSPLSRLTAAPRPGPRTPCPLAVEPGVSFGPVALGETLETLKKAGLVLKEVSESQAELTLPGGTGEGTRLGIALCDGKIIEIWIDDLRKTPACVSYQGKPLAAQTPREEVEKLFGGCSPTPPRIGGAIENCAGGGVYLGHGMGDFLQIRVRPRSFEFDDSCERARDDGSPIELPAEVRTDMLKKTLNLPVLGSHWHVDQPGRDPLRIVRTPIVPEQPLTMFGSPAVWIPPSEATKGTAFLTLTDIKATRTRATLAFAYPIEGVTGTVTFLHQGKSWEIEKSEVKAR
jgi:hypothetical protein